MTIYVINHTTVDTPANTCLGQMDINLLNSYPSEIAILKEQLPTHFDKVISSPLKRCTYVAEAFSNHYKIDNRLISMNFGEWELQSWRTIRLEQREAWGKDLEFYTPPYGESFHQVKLRINQFIEDLKKEQAENILLVTDIVPANYLRCKYNASPVTDLIELIQPLRAPFSFSL